MTDQTVATKVPEALGTLPNRLVVFDGVCVLCSAFARFIARHDKRSQFHFVTAQSPLGTALFRAHGLRTDTFETNLVLIDGVAHTHFATFTAVADALGWPWRAATILNLLPTSWRRWLYNRVAANRYAWFGKKDVCDIPSAQLRGQLIE